MRWPWVDSLETWLDDLLRPGDVNVVRDGTNTAINLASSRITVMSYPLLNNPSIIAQVEKQRFQLVIADESHYVKDAKVGPVRYCSPLHRM